MTPVPQQPDFIVVGAMRSGSSSLYRYLADHPGVFMTTPKELHYFDRQFERGLDWYLQHFAAAPAGALRGECTPSYLSEPQALERMAAALPEVQTVAVLRNPVDRAYSHYMMLHARGRERRSWDEVLRKESERDVPGGYLHRSRYGQQLAQLHGLVGADRCHVLPFELLRDEPTKAFGAVCDYLGLSRTAPASLGRQVNAYFTTRSLRVRTFTKRPWVPRRVRNAVARLNQKEVAYPRQTAEQRAVASRALAADTARAVTLAGWDRNPWSGA